MKSKMSIYIQYIHANKNTKRFSLLLNKYEINHKLLLLVVITTIIEYFKILLKL